MTKTSAGWRARLVALAVVAAFQPALIQAQTKITAPDNKFKPSEDVELGQKAAAQAREQLPLVRNESVDSFVDEIGRQLVAAVPPEFRHPQFRYSFEVVNASDINAFALPGGPMFINRGMIAAAKTEGEVASVMAHELSHVVLRHGTAQASKAQKYQLGQIAGQVIGAIVGGTAGAVISQGSQFGLGAAFLRFSREYERQADLLGAQIMARAGYDPDDMARMFQTIAARGGSGTPEWLSSHPNPGNRSEAIEAEARQLEVQAPLRADNSELRSVQARLAQMPPARTTEEITRNAGGQAGQGEPGATGTSGRISPDVEPPARALRTYTIGDVFDVSVPQNWVRQGSGNSVRFAPEGGAGTVGGHDVFTHGIEFGVAGDGGGDLREATNALVQAFSRANPQLRVEGQAEPTSFAGRRGLQLELGNVSEATGERERVLLSTALLDDGTLFYSVGVAPAGEYGQYAPTLERVNESVRIK